MGHQRRGPRRSILLGTALVLLVVAVALVGIGLRGKTTYLKIPVEVKGTTTTVPGAAIAYTMAHSVPLAISIPSLAVHSTLVGLGLNADGTVQVPSSPNLAGWYDGDATPGELGAAVILGHVDSTAGPGIFYRLGELRPGQQIMVSRVDHTTATFVVDAVRQYPKAAFPARSIYLSPGRATLQLVTCGGQFDPQTGHYLSNIVVFSHLLAPPGWRPN